MKTYYGAGSPSGAAPFADKVICEASTYEPTPLGAAEWLKFYGAFYGTVRSGWRRDAARGAGAAAV